MFRAETRQKEFVALIESWHSSKRVRDNFADRIIIPPKRSKVTQIGAALSQ